jgi:hypothetical protein
MISSYSDVPNECELITPDNIITMFYVVVNLLTTWVVVCVCSCRYNRNNLLQTNIPLVATLYDLGALVSMAGVSSLRQNNCDGMITVQYLFIIGIVFRSLLTGWLKFLVVIVGTMMPVDIPIRRILWLPVYTYVSGEISNEQERIQLTDTTCPIELEAFKDGDEVIRLDCGHTFKRVALCGWLNVRTECPVCRREIADERDIMVRRMENDGEQIREAVVSAESTN